MTLRLNLTNRVIVKKNSMRILRSSNGKPFLLSSKAFKKFQSLSTAELMAQCHGLCFTNPIRIEYSFLLKGKLDSDLDNLIASVNDVLVHSGVLKDDSLIREIVATKIAGCRSFETDIVISGEL